MIKRTKIFLILIIVIHNYCVSQIYDPATPYSLRNKLKFSYEIPTYYINDFIDEKYIKEDSIKFISNRFAIKTKINIDVKKEGLITKITEGKIWRYRIIASRCKGIGIRFSQFYIPDGSMLFLYDNNYRHLLGAYTSANNKEDGFFAVQHIQSDECIIEYFEPNDVQTEGNIYIDYVSLAYKDISYIINQYNDVNCPEWNEWQIVKHSVCRILYDDTDGSYYCTGSLINNTKFDGTPYFLTANHCINKNLSAQSVIAYFNYETDTCNGNLKTPLQTISGADLLLHATETDFSLIKFRELPPDSYYPFYSGWDNSRRIPNTTSVIHHPEALQKSISESKIKPHYYEYSISWDDGSTTPPYSHWEVTFTNGTTNSGSSGAPLFNEQQQIIGQLHGGDNVTNYYGSFSVSWSLTTSTNTLKTFLDPINSGLTSIKGTRGKANFTFSPLKPCKYGTVILSPYNKENFTSYKWIINPNSFYFDNNTSDTSQLPNIVFTKDTIYNVTLFVSNKYYTDSITNKIIVSEINIKFIGIDDQLNICGNEMKNKIFQVSGDYYNKFIFDSIQFSYSLIDNNTISLSLKDSNSNTFSTKLIVEAYHGICKASDSTTLNIIKDENDKIANSVELKLGLNGPFSNQCSNIEENEPSPPFNGCYADNSWCTENNSKETIRNTIWFKLKGPSNGILNLKTSGFNTRIALYEANTANDLLNNNYKLLAANDDNASGTSAILKNVHVVPGKTYYLQLDGYKGEVGECFINYYSENIEIFPNPTISYINIIISSENEAEGTLKIFNLSGEQMASKKIKITPQLNKFIFDLSALNQGLYFLSFQTNDYTYVSKFVKIKP